jgi:hypothetical protein
MAKKRALLEGIADDISEMEFLDPERVDAVGSPANGVPFLMLKSQGEQFATQSQRSAEQDRLARRALAGEYGLPTAVAAAGAVEQHRQDAKVPALRPVNLGGNSSDASGQYDDAERVGESLKALRALAMLAARKKAAARGRPVTYRDVSREADRVVGAAAAMSPAIKRLVQTRSVPATIHRGDGSVRTEYIPTAKSTAGKRAGLAVLKSDAERRYTLGLAYPADRADVTVALDGFRDFVGKDALEQAAWSFLRKGARVGLHHQDGTEGHGTVVESYIYRGPDWPQPNGYIVKANDWLIGVIWDEPTWQAIKGGEFNGFSPQGRARRRTPSAKALASLRS